MRNNQEPNEPRVGYLYILTNPCLSCNNRPIVKIGLSSNHPLHRSYQLSAATGVPTPFHVAYYRSFDDCVLAEGLVHTALDQYRVSDNREFFAISLDDAIEIVDRLSQDINQEAQNQRYLSPQTAESTMPSTPFAELFSSFTQRADDDPFRDVLTPEEAAQCRLLERQLQL